MNQGNGVMNAPVHPICLVWVSAFLWGRIDGLLFSALVSIMHQLKQHPATLRPERRKIMENTCIAIWRVHSFSIANGSYLGSIALR
jgi:hypothetical protein